MSPASDGTFIAVEVEDSVRGDVELAKKLEEACPVDIFAAAEDGVHDRAGEPRRVRALRAVPGRLAARRACGCIKLYDGGAELERAA